jgi:hypothetical protein
MDKSGLAADQPHWNMNFDARCDCCATRRVFGRCVAHFTLARSQTITIADCCNCNGIRVVPCWTRLKRSPISFRPKRGRCRPAGLRSNRFPLNWDTGLARRDLRDDRARTTRQSVTCDGPAIDRIALFSSRGASGTLRSDRRGRNGRSADQVASCAARRARASYPDRMRHT